jgi:predicted dehydrogenase
MDSAKPLRVNVVGRGPWGQNIVRTLKELGAEVPIVANRETGWEAAFEGEPDRICVAAHPSVNLPVVLECDKRGIPVWIEKPAALNLADVERMAECKVPIFVDYTYRFAKFREKAAVDLLAGVMSGKCHDYGMLYDWAPHIVAFAIMHPSVSFREFDEPLKNACACFLGDPWKWTDFILTGVVHRIIDAAERKNASR